MTKLSILTFLTFLLWATLSGAVSPLCTEDKQDTFGECRTRDSAGKTSSGIAESLSKLQEKLWVSSTAESIQDLYRHKKDLYADMFRLIENGKLDNKKNEPRIQREIDDTLIDAQSLLQLGVSLNAVKARLEICYSGNCGAHRRVELEDQLLLLQRSKTALLIKRPLFTHESFEKEWQKKSENIPTDAEIKKLISNASRETAASLLKRVDEYSRFLDSDMKELPATIADDFITRFESQGPAEGKSAWLCELATKRAKARERDALVKSGVEVSLFLAPFALGPWGRFGLLGSETLLGAKLLRFGLSAKEIDSAAWLARAGTGVSTNLFQTNETKKLGDQCQSLEDKFFLKPDTRLFDSLNNCKTEYNDAVFISTLGWITTIGPELPGPALQFYKKKFTPQLVSTSAFTEQIGTSLQKNPLAKNQWAREYQTMDQGKFTYMDLSKISRVSDHQMRQVPDDYWNFVGNIYSERLNLTPEEIKGFVKSSQEFAPRTKLIINSDDSLTNSKNFKGGVGIVVSDKPQDLLPVEKAIGKNVERKPSDKVAEIVRLTVSKDADAEKLSKSLINQAAGALLQDPDIKKVYVYTSKVHGRLYKRLGVKAESIVPQGERDIIISLSRADIENLLAKTR